MAAASASATRGVSARVETDGRDGVRGVVEAVGVVEAERDEDDDGDDAARAPRSGLLDGDRLDRVGDVLEGVGGRLELVDDVLELEHLSGSYSPLNSVASSRRWTWSASFSSRLISIQ